MGRQTVIVSVLANTSNFKRGMGDVASTLGGLGSKLGGMAKTGVAAVGAIGAAIAGIAAKKGISRALAIEDAQAKLRALGADVETVTQVSKDALAAVKGTAFGLDAAATTAASALAAQIKPGKDLQRYLGLVADTAQIAGTSMEEMGSIFGKVATNQKVGGSSPSGRAAAPLGAIHRWGFCISTKHSFGSAYFMPSARGDPIRVTQGRCVLSWPRWCIAGEPSQGRGPGWRLKEKPPPLHETWGVMKLGL